MDTERALLISKTVMVLGFLMAAVGILGEILGWWSDTGEVLTTVGTIAGALGGFAGVIVGSSSEEVQAVHAAVQDNGETLDSVDGKLDKLDKLDTVDAKLDKLEELDVIQAELDRQTGALDRQVEVLGQIRDRL